MSNWYLLRNGQTYGPYPEEQVREWVRAGQIAPDEKLTREGDANWLSLDMIPEFSGGSSAFQPAANLVPVAAVLYAPVQRPHCANPPKDRTVAAILAFLLGWVGGHHFYLGNISLGVVYLLLAWTLIPLVLGIIEGIIYLTKPQDQFQGCYHKWFCCPD